jgi:hypothetical protein
VDIRLSKRGEKINSLFRPPSVLGCVSNSDLEKKINPQATFEMSVLQLEILNSVLRNVQLLRQQLN